MRKQRRCATTRTLRNALLKLNMIEAHNEISYISGTSKANFGDIYIKEGSHVVCYVNDGNPVTISSNIKTDTKYAKTYKTTTDLHLRNGAGTDNKSLVVMPNGIEFKKRLYPIFLWVIIVNLINEFLSSIIEFNRKESVLCNSLN